MKCKNCGATLDEGALFCRKCGTAVPQAPEPAKKKRLTFKLPDLSGLLKNRRLLISLGVGAALLIVLIVVIVAVSSCKPSSTHFETPEQVSDAVLDALRRGDGDALAKMAKVSEPFLGQHTEAFGDGEDAEAVMRGYYGRMADNVHGLLSEQFNSDAVLEADLDVDTLTGSSIFEENSTLDIDADAYTVHSGTLYVGDTELDNIQIVSARIDGEWKLIVVYLY